MRTRLALALVASSAIGCGDDIKFPEPPPPPDPAINAVIPAEGFSGRTIRVQVSGDDTELTSAATLDFGAGIAVSDINLASPSDLFATLTIAPDATLGEHDVKIKDGTVELTLAKAFEVQTPIEIVPQGGDPQQGGFAFIAIVNHDVANPFPPDPTLIQVTAGNGVNGFINQNDPFTAFAVLLIDTDGASGPVELTYNFGTTQVVSRGTDLAVTPRTAIPVTVDTTATNQNLATASALFTFTPGTPALVFGTATPDPTNPNAGFPGVVFLPGGKWANARFQSGDDQGRLPALSQTFVTVFDTQTAGYKFDLDVITYQSLPGVVSVSESEPNDDSATADAVADVGLFSADITDFAPDFMKVSATAGQTIRVITTQGGQSGTTDTEITIFDTDGTTEIVLATDNNFAEDVTSPPVPTTGDYFVQITPSFFCFFFGGCDRYEAAVLVENLTLARPAPQAGHLPIGVATNAAARLRRPQP